VIGEKEAAAHPNGGVRHLPFRHTSSMGVTSVLCLIEKAGSTTWNALLEHDRHIMPQIGGALSTATPPVVTLVRNPYARFLSAFLDKAARHKRGITFNGTFAEFAVNLAGCDPDIRDGTCPRRDVHFTPQLKHCYLSDGFRYDLVLRIEEMPMWYEAVMAMLGLRTAAQSFTSGGADACFYAPPNVTCDDLFRTSKPRTYSGASKVHADSHATFANDVVLREYTAPAARAANVLFGSDVVTFGYTKWDGVGRFELMPRNELSIALRATDLARTIDLPDSADTATAADIGSISIPADPLGGVYDPPGPRHQTLVNREASDCLRWAELKLPCSGSEWWVNVIKSFQQVKVKPQLIGGQDSQISEEEALTQMTAHLTTVIGPKIRGLPGTECILGWATNPLNAPQRIWKSLGSSLEKIGARTVLWKRTNLAHMASSAMFKGNTSNACARVDNIDAASDPKLIEACHTATLYFPPPLFLNMIAVIACQSSLQDRIARVISPHDEPVRAYYEALQLDREAEPRRVFAALGLKNITGPPQHEESKPKKHPESLRESVDNFDEVAEHLRALDEELGPTGCSPYAMFVADQPRVWSECSPELLCSALHAKLELDWEEDTPPPLPWHYVMSHSGAGKSLGTWDERAEKLHFYVRGSFKDYNEWTNSSNPFPNQG